MFNTGQPRPVPAAKLERLGAWARRKPRIALMGEFSSGKSTLLNLLIGEELLPTKVTATELPPVWFSHGAPCAYWVGRDGVQHPMDFGSFRGVPMTARYVRVFAPAPMLERCDIIDTPGISDPNLEEDSWRFAVGQANFILWCTSATQAWRETERSTWTSLPARLRSKSVLVVTRADKLGSGDREKVTRRLARESFGLFGGMVLLSSLAAVQARAMMDQTGDDSLWNLTGGADLSDRLEAGLDAVAAERLDLLDRYVAVEPEARPEPAFVAFAPEPEPEPEQELRPAATVSPLHVLPRSASPEDEEPAVPSSALARLFGPPGGVRPRRVDVPDTRRTERPSSEDSADPLGAVRENLRTLRSLEEERGAPSPVLRLPDQPVRPEPPALSEFGSGDEDDSVLLAQRSEAEEVPGPDHAAASSLSDIEIAPEGESQPQPMDEALPRAVRIWREIIERNPEIPSNSPVLAMIDQLLFELSRDKELFGGTGQTTATTAGRTRVA